MPPMARGLLLALLLMTTACDVFVRPGQTTVLGNRGAVFAVNSPNAVTVVDGTLVVQDADVFGLGRVVDAFASDFPAPGAGVRAIGGAVRVQRGRVAGGNILVDPTPAPPVSMLTEVRGILLAPGILSQFSSVEIDGGTIVSSGIFGAARLAVQAPAVLASFGSLQIRGGEIRPGERPGPITGLSLGPALYAQASALDISGGRLTGSVELFASQALIRGGVFEGALVLGSSRLGILFFGSEPRVLSTAGCTELRGGTLGAIQLATAGEQLFIFGSGFNLPLGPVPAPAATPVRVTGILESGTPLDVQIGGDSILGAPSSVQIMLVAPGGAGCTPPIVE